MHTLPLSSYLPNVSTLAYGCMGLGGNWDRSAITDEHIKQGHAVIDCALDNGINLFDHADIYTLGKAEQVFGNILAARPSLRESLFLQSKCGIRFDDDKGPKRYDLSKDWIIYSVEQSLKRLHTDYLDILLLHRPDPLMQPDEIAEAFEALHSAGKAKHLGVSNMNSAQIQYLQRAIDAPIVANQIEISLHQRQWLEDGVMVGNPAGKDLNFSSGTLEYCQMHNVQVQSWGSLAQGLFTGKHVADESESVQQTAKYVAQLAAEYQTSPEAIVLAFLLRHPSKIQPVLGTTNLARIKACVAATSVNLTREHWYRLFETARGEALP
ncbi:aldo/keto reductase [Aestuariibacter sp. AA17]|uniref:Aldo/keto reductase n=1 Tax=Fluctibacter corallii TaxID=2984329 RepID=A0ABT3ACA1_9ALTE|nr:aldo/keto reductase [Aestuariibacter sp. AA17]MCV2886313.1 aldo/keto reductase [Aestuariibacter sp. AA17]